jgi:hypothetical protein
MQARTGASDAPHRLKSGQRAEELPFLIVRSVERPIQSSDRNGGSSNSMSDSELSGSQSRPFTHLPIVICTYFRQFASGSAQRQARFRLAMGEISAPTVNADCHPMPKKSRCPQAEPETCFFPESARPMAVSRRQDLLPDSELRPPSRRFGPETEEDYYLRLVAELQGFDLGMAIDPITDLDVLERLNDTHQSKCDASTLAYRLATSDDRKIRRATDRILAANSILARAGRRDNLRQQRSHSPAG